MYMKFSARRNTHLEYKPTTQTDASYLHTAVGKPKGQASKNERHNREPQNKCQQKTSQRVHGRARVGHK